MELDLPTPVSHPPSLGWRLRTTRHTPRAIAGQGGKGLRWLLTSWLVSYFTLMSFAQISLHANVTQPQFFCVIYLCMYKNKSLFNWTFCQLLSEKPNCTKLCFCLKISFIICGLLEIRPVAVAVAATLALVAWIVVNHRTGVNVIKPFFFTG
jgi:hypothetical protein